MVEDRETWKIKKKMMTYGIMRIRKKTKLIPLHTKFKLKRINNHITVSNSIILIHRNVNTVSELTIIQGNTFYFIFNTFTHLSPH